MIVNSFFFVFSQNFYYSPPPPSLQIFLELFSLSSFFSLSPSAYYQHHHHLIILMSSSKKGAKPKSSHADHEKKSSSGEKRHHDESSAAAVAKKPKKEFKYLASLENLSSSIICAEGKVVEALIQSNFELLEVQKEEISSLGTASTPKSEVESCVHWGIMGTKSSVLLSETEWTPLSLPFPVEKKKTVDPAWLENWARLGTCLASMTGMVVKCMLVRELDRLVRMKQLEPAEAEEYFNAWEAAAACGIPRCYPRLVWRRSGLSGPFVSTICGLLKISDAEWEARMKPLSLLDRQNMLKAYEAKKQQMPHGAKKTPSDSDASPSPSSSPAAAEKPPAIINVPHNFAENPDGSVRFSSPLLPSAIRVHERTLVVVLSIAARPEKLELCFTLPAVCAAGRVFSPVVGADGPEAGENDGAIEFDLKTLSHSAPQNCPVRIKKETV